MEELQEAELHQFELRAPTAAKIGDEILLMGFPFGQANLVCHAGHVSSFFKNGAAAQSVIQVDASVNQSNSGGPLIEVEGGNVIGLISRKATGLTQLITELKNSIDTNIKIANDAAAGGSISIAGIDPTQGLIVVQKQMKNLCVELERSANVGIGYAISAEHLLAEPPFADL